MDKKLITYILAGTGAALIFISFILLCSSAGLVGDIKDVLEPAVRVKNEAAFDYGNFSYSDLENMLSAGSTGLDVKFNAGLVKDMFGGDNKIMLRQYGINGAGFRMFALNARGWCFWLGILSLAASAVVMAMNANGQLVSRLKELCRDFAAAIVEGFKSTFAGIKIKLPKRTPKVVFSCPKCGASFVPGASFCGACGSQLPTAAEMGLCPRCGAVNEPGSRFCSSCGNPLA